MVSEAGAVEDGMAAAVFDATRTAPALMMDDADEVEVGNRVMPLGSAKTTDAVPTGEGPLAYTVATAVEVCNNVVVVVVEVKDCEDDDDDDEPVETETDTGSEVAIEVPLLLLRFGSLHRAIIMTGVGPDKELLARAIAKSLVGVGNNPAAFSIDAVSVELPSTS